MEHNMEVLDKGNVVNFTGVARIGSTLDYVRIPACVRDELKLKNKEKVIITMMRNGS